MKLLFTIIYIFIPNVETFGNPQHVILEYIPHFTCRASIFSHCRARIHQINSNFYEHCFNTCISSHCTGHVSCHCDSIFPNWMFYFYLHKEEIPVGQLLYSILVFTCISSTSHFPRFKNATSMTPVRLSTMLHDHPTVSMPNLAMANHIFYLQYKV